MARNYEKELAAAEAKVKRIKQQKEAAERRKYEPVGRAMYEVFSHELSGLNGQKETKAFCRELRKLYDRAHSAGAQSTNAQAVNTRPVAPEAASVVPHVEATPPVRAQVERPVVERPVRRFDDGQVE